MQLFIRKMDGQKFTLDVEPSDTITSVKDKVRDQLGIPPDNYNFIYAGKLLEDEHTLPHYRIQNESTIYLMLKPLKTKMDIVMVGKSKTITVTFKQSLLHHNRRDQS